MYAAGKHINPWQPYYPLWLPLWLADVLILAHYQNSSSPVWQLGTAVFLV
jgi:hypothetical protein